MTTFYTTLETPLGKLILAGTAHALTRILFPSEQTRGRPDSGCKRDDAVFNEALDQLNAYFAGELQRFDLPLAPRGTPFQHEVWNALREIPFGTTVSYGELAARIGRPSASRAVGAANGRNPLPIVVPCHRVIGANGHLTGFGGGLATKEWLLTHEGAIPGTAELFGPYMSCGSR